MPAECKFVLDQHVGSVHCVRLTHDGAYCMTAGEDRTLKLWNPHKEDPRYQGKQDTVSSSSTSMQDPPKALCVQTYGGVHGYKVLDVAISRDKNKFASAGDDRSVYLWDVGTSRVIRRFQAHLQRTNAVMLNIDDTVLFTASNDKSVKCWDLRAQNNNRDPIDTLMGSTDSVTAIAQIENAILTASVDGAVRIYDLRKGCLQTDAISSDPITSLSISADERMYLITCLETNLPRNQSDDHTQQRSTVATGVVRLVDISSGQLFREYRGHLHQSVKVEAAFAPDRKQIIAGGEDGRIFHWDIIETNITDETITVVPTGAAGNSRYTVQAQPGKHAISSLAYHPDEEKHLFLSASFDGSVKVWKTNHAV